jgi:hypothetical protein
MADYSQTVVEGLRVFGGAPTNQWEAYNWNAFTWGEGNNAFIANPLVLISDSQSLAQTDEVQAAFFAAVAEAITTGMVPTSEVLTDGSGYSYVFPNNTTDGEERDPVSWASGAAGSTSWSSGTAGSTDWS